MSFSFSGTWPEPCVNLGQTLGFQSNPQFVAIGPATSCQDKELHVYFSLPYIQSEAERPCFFFFFCAHANFYQWDHVFKTSSLLFS